MIGSVGVGVCVWLDCMSNGRRQRHHVVPRLHLRGFADPDQRIIQLDLRTGRRLEVSVTDAAVIRNFYTVVLPDGTSTDAWERWLADLENEIAPAVRRAIEMPSFELDDADRERLSRWVALQYLRGPDNRRQMTELAAFALRAQVGMGGLAYLQHAMSNGMGREVSAVEAERVWDDIQSEHGPEVVVDGEEHLQVLSRAFDRSTDMVYGRSWGRVRFERKRLLASDAPVSLIPGERWPGRFNSYRCPVGPPDAPVAGAAWGAEAVRRPGPSLGSPVREYSQPRRSSQRRAVLVLPP